jgi:hypothetical protein
MMREGIQAYCEEFATGAYLSHAAWPSSAWIAETLSIDNERTTEQANVEAEGLCIVIDGRC